MAEFILVILNLPLLILAVSMAYRLRLYWSVRDARQVDRVDELSEGQDVLVEGSVRVDEDDVIECPANDRACIYYNWRMRRRVRNEVPDLETLRRRSHIETSHSSRAVRRFVLVTKDGEIPVITTAAEWFPDAANRSGNGLAGLLGPLGVMVDALVAGDDLDLIPADAHVRVAGRVREMGGSLEIKSSLDHPAVITDAPAGQLRTKLFAPYLVTLVVTVLLSASMLANYVRYGRDEYAEGWRDEHARENLLRRRR